MGSLIAKWALAGVASAIVFLGSSAPDLTGPMAGPLACPVTHLEGTSIAQINGAATQGCVLPALDPLSQAPIEEISPESVARDVPPRAIDYRRDQIIAAALAAGLSLSVLASRDDADRKCEC